MRDLRRRVAHRTSTRPETSPFPFGWSGLEGRLGAARILPAIVALAGNWPPSGRVPTAS